MRALVIYESMFGNTRLIAEAIAEGLGTEAVEVSAAPGRIGADIDLLVVGGPTHAFGMTRPSTRKSAADQATEELVSKGRGLREWLADARTDGCAAAAFDTRVSKPRLPGSAAKGAVRRLRRLGVALAAPPESFYVTGTTGPLVDGELERARRWGEALARSVTV